MSKYNTISILMPIYNASSYLRQALDSVVEQALDNIEIICINDGSTDDSLEIIQEYAKNDKRIIVIDKPNSGYGDSMNHGLGIAKGEYIAILEPDDWYEANILSILYGLAKQNNLDVIKCDFYQYSNQTQQNKQYHLFKPDQCNKVVDSNEDKFIYSLQPSIWSAIYKRSFLNKNNIRFLNTPGASYQDTSFNFKVFALAQRVMFMDTPLIHYRIDNNQSSINNIVKKLPNIDTEYDEIDDFVISHKLSNELSKTAITCRYRTYLWAMEQLRGSDLHNFIKHSSYVMQKKQALNTSNSDLQALHLLCNCPNLFYLIKSLKFAFHSIKLHIRQFRQSK